MENLKFDTDWHMHTKEFSSCAKISLPEIVELKKKTGLRTIAVTEHSSHFYLPWDTTFPTYLDKPDVFAQLKEEGNRKMAGYISIMKSHRESGILTGLELDYIIGDGLFFDEIFRSSMDVIIGSVHWLRCMLPFFEKCRGDSSKACPLEEDEFLAAMKQIIESGIDIVGHPTHLFQWARRPVPVEVTNKIMDMAFANGTAVEINTAYRNPNEYFVRKWLERGGKIAVSTDTHHTHRFGDFSYAAEILSICGVTMKNLKNILFQPKKRNMKNTSTGSYHACKSSYR